MNEVYRLLIVLFGVIYLPSIVLAQNVEFDKKNFSKDDKKLFKEAHSELKEGNDYYEVERYATALQHYKAAQAFNPDNAELNYKVGKCYLKTMTKVKAIPFLEKARKLNPMVAADVRYLLGQGYHLNYEFDKAMEEFKAYRSNPGVGADEITAMLEIVNKKIQECIMGKKLVAEPARVFIDNLKAVNSPYPEYSPLISADESIMIFTSRRSNTTGGGKDEGSDFHYFEDVYMSYQTEGQWSAPVNIGRPINTDVHDATVGLSPDGQSLFVYRFEMGDGGDIYQCELEGERWSKPKHLGKNINTKYHESSACFSNDGRTMYFVSDKPEGGLGGRDMYRATLDNPDAKVGNKKRWGSPFNLSTTLNTKYSEEGVFMHPDGKTLYFSSRGHETMGGYDIFKAVKDDNGQWGKPENLGYPINTPDDDVFFVISASGKHGYYSSIKSDGMGEKDIYRVTFLGPEKSPVLNNEDNLLASLTNPVSETVIEEVVEIRTVSLTILKGTVTDAVTEDKVEAGIELIDNEKNKVIANFKSNATTGKYLVSLPAGKNYGLAVKAEGYLFHSENFDIPKSAGYTEVIKDIELKKVAVGSKIVLKNIFFDFDKATLRDESTSELERLTKLLNDVPTLKIEISGHTDSKGADAYNLKLSERRAHAVVDYLVVAGIAKDRLTYKGAGESEPVSTNDTEAGRQENRRTEFKVLAK
jgi:outer membrane protein OmpA-like peptidoglycan-associated protein